MKFLNVPVIFLSDIVSVGTIVILPQIFRNKYYNNIMMSIFKLNVIYSPVNVELNLETAPVLLLLAS